MKVTQEVIDKIQAAYPQAHDHPPYPPATPQSSAEADDEFRIVMDHIVKALRRMGRLREPGPLGMRPEHLLALAGHLDYQETFCHIMARIAVGRIHPEALRHLRRGQIIPKAKPP